MKTVLIIDYNMGNIDSISRAVEECGGIPIVSNKDSDFEAASNLILPGVGSFAKAMENIKKFNIKSIIKEQVIIKKKPLLGICLGMQILASKGYEGGETKGLNFIEGEVILLNSSDLNHRIPHVGWNEITFSKPSVLFNNLKSGIDFYFVHKYHFCCKDHKNILAYTPYCGNFVSVVGKDNIFGVQFHPEKSQRSGFQIMKNFINI